MANVSDNIILAGSSGAIGKEFVLKIINGNTYRCKYPDMTKVINNPSPKQRAVRDNFGKMSKKAKVLCHEPGISEVYPARVNQPRFRAIMQDFLQEPIPEPDKQPIEDFISQHNKKQFLTAQQQAALDLLQKYDSITNTAYQILNNVSKATATRHLRDLVNKNRLMASGKKGAAVRYVLPVPELPTPNDGTTFNEG